VLIVSIVVPSQVLLSVVPPVPENSYDIKLSSIDNRVENSQKSLSVQHQNDTEMVDLVDTVDDAAYSNTAVIVQLLRDNYTRWQQHRQTGQ
jgi:hypothetical protein